MLVKKERKLNWPIKKGNLKLISLILQYLARSPLLL